MEGLRRYHLKMTDTKPATVVCEGNALLVEGTARAKDLEWKEVGYSEELLSVFSFCEILQN